MKNLKLGFLSLIAIVVAGCAGGSWYEVPNLTMVMGNCTEANIQKFRNTQTYLTPAYACMHFQKAFAGDIRCKGKEYEVTCK